MQQMNFKGSSIDEIANTLVYKRLSLDYNYRLPKTIAKSCSANSRCQGGLVDK